MAYINANYLNLKDSYLFSEINRKVREEAAKNPDKKIIRMGIGDVTLPLVPEVVSAMHNAVDEMASAETFRGYGPEQGYEFLREDISKYYAAFGVEVAPGEIFISDGTKSDIANITDIFSNENTNPSFKYTTSILSPILGIVYSKIIWPVFKTAN